MAVAALLLATLCWGLWGFAEGRAVTHTHPINVQWVYAIPSAMAIPVLAFAGRHVVSGREVPLPAYGWALLAGVAGLAALLLFTWSLRSIPASSAAAVSSAYPVVTLAIALAAGTEKPGATELIGIALIVAGVAALVRGHA